MKSFKYILMVLLVLTAPIKMKGQAATDVVPATDQPQQAVSSAGGAQDQGAVKASEADSVTSQDAVQEAAQAYRDRDYKKSIALYESLIAQGLKEGKESAQLYYNLGNAYFRDNQLGKALLNYERAFLLDPGDGDIRHNLRFARSRTVDRIDTAGDLFFYNWFLSVRNLYSSNVWATIGIGLFIMLLVCVALFLFVRNLTIRKTAFYAGIVLFILVIMANIFAFDQKRERIYRDEAIVMVGAAPVNASPDEHGNTLFELHEGTKVKIRSADGNWYEIEISDGSVGWTSKQNVEII